MFIRCRRDCNILKTLEKFVLPANENFTTFFKKHVYESWRCSFKAFILKKGKYLWLDLHYVHKVELGQRHTWKRSKNLFYPQMKILQQWGYNTLNPPLRFWDFEKYFLNKKTNKFANGTHYFFNQNIAKINELESVALVYICTKRIAKMWFWEVFLKNFLSSLNPPPL